MAKKSLMNKCRRANERKMAALAKERDGGPAATFTTRAYTRCKRCGRVHAVLRKFGLCRICFREMAVNGQIPGVTKASW